MTIHEHLNFVRDMPVFLLFTKPANRCSLTLLYDRFFNRYRAH